MNRPIEAESPISELSKALAFVDDHVGRPEDLRLAIDEKLLDPAGINMATVTDRILARGWEPDGFEQRRGYRLYRYKSTQ